MDLEFTADERKFRDEVGVWIAENYTDDLKKRMALTKNGSLDETHQKAWLKKLAEKGWLVTNRLDRAWRARVGRRLQKDIDELGRCRSPARRA